MEAKDKWRQRAKSWRQNGKWRQSSNGWKGQMEARSNGGKGQTKAHRLESEPQNFNLDFINIGPNIIVIPSKINNSQNICGEYTNSKCEGSRIGLHISIATVWPRLRSFISELIRCTRPFTPSARLIECHTVQGPRECECIPRATV